MDGTEQVFQIRTHLLYEVKWMIYAAHQFEDERWRPVEVALLDSATMHARNLLEFAYDTSTLKFTATALGGTRQPGGEWVGWLNNRQTHMGERELKWTSWPSGVDFDGDRLVTMAGAVLDVLEAAVEGMEGDTAHWYRSVVGAARSYCEEPTEVHLAKLDALYDSTRDGRHYKDGGTTASFLLRTTSSRDFDQT